MTESLTQLVESLRQLPSVGEKSAWRMALWLMDQDEIVSSRISSSIITAREKLQHCSLCHTWSEEEFCSVCKNEKRNRSLVCVVERPSDMYAIENSGRFDGVYHVLGGVLSPMNGVTIDSLTIADLVHRVSLGGIDEIIIGLGGSSEAETTAHYISKVLESSETLITRFSRGLAAGMEIEYADRYTLDQALSERREVKYGE
jgi:recombination protein RecR